ncbi:MAG: SlyX family protein [Verrucomicrobiales bacterium]|nr:SlyX family protein [Verrucomicrobiales bacterium]
MSNRTEPSDHPSSGPGEQRFVSLESHVAELERMADELNKIVIEHGKAIRRLQSQQTEMNDTLRTVEIERIRNTNPKPPHSAL